MRGESSVASSALPKTSHSQDIELVVSRIRRCLTTIASRTFCSLAGRAITFGARVHFGGFFADLALFWRDRWTKGRRDFRRVRPLREMLLSRSIRVEGLDACSNSLSRAQMSIPALTLALAHEPHPEWDLHPLARLAPAHATIYPCNSWLRWDAQGSLRVLECCYAASLRRTRATLPGRLPCTSSQSKQATVLETTAAARRRGRDAAARSAPIR